ncbi:uncharacterized protein Bfra_002086 [Botrytis fragariae]|uniref:Uncharacterized protein n=1 Tax=Botrytis fragariae TaxID=1964551 RepID=A0A8H6B1H9_9HELO|nr:uncharacterized protein Bfra_002086 [Botrytis fragariae]KAF5877718.1 hypothetical protein Bfra_002086 [Botrytis fragariae]
MGMNRHGKENTGMEGSGIIYSNNDSREIWEYFLMAMDMYGFATGWLDLRRLNIRMGEVDSERASLFALTERGIFLGDGNYDDDDKIDGWVGG